MKKKSFLILAIISISTFFKIQAQDSAISTIPFELIENKFIFIKCVVNEKDTLTFVFDTGSEGSLIDKNTADKLGIKPSHEEEVEGGGGIASLQVSKKNNLYIGDVKLRKVDLAIIDLSRLINNMSRHFDGIIGYSILKKYLTKIDFDNRVIKLYPKRSSLELSSYSKHSFSFDNGVQIPQLDIEIQLKNSKKYKGKVLFDSGAGLTLLVNTPFAKENKLVTQVDNVFTSTNDYLNKKSTTQEIAIKHLSLGHYSFSDLSIQLSSDTEGASSHEGYMGILGAEIINRFNIVLDYKNKMLYLSPNKLHNIPF